MKPSIRASALFSLLLIGGCGGPSAPEANRCGPYPEQSTSSYVLPYEVGSEFVISQGNCTLQSHAAGSTVAYAYDFRMPIGTRLVAVRGGTVLLVQEQYTDGDHTPGRENFINVTHADGSIAAYVHLTRDGALVEVGDVVAQGQVIALSGDTGDSSEPHLHLHVQRCNGCDTVPIVFRNTRAHPQGLQEGQTYRAEPSQ